MFENEPATQNKQKSIFKKVRPGCLLSVLGLSLSMGLIFSAAIYLTRDIATQADAFLTALTNENYASAYEILTPEVQGKVESAKGFEQSIIRSKIQPSDWRVTSRRIENGIGEVAGTITYIDGHKSNFVLNLHQIDGEWKIYNAELLR